ncbi:MAG TPA: hypothetical protein EYG46_08255 [Myxococcales bacterium]|nr:hypothetical protein [Myxococcales bacterium]HIM00968.1 hypothetical protein [Myxococcales bacterium]
MNLITNTIVQPAPLNARATTHRAGAGFVRLIAALAVAAFALACGPNPPNETTATVPVISAAPPSSDVPPDDIPAPAEPSRYRGLWILCEGSQRVLEDPKKIALLIKDAHELGVTDLFVQVYRGGRAWYRAEQADSAPYRAMVANGAEDPLALLLQKAHASGLRVHAWVNVLSLSRNLEAPIFKDLGRSAIHVDRRGRSILDYPADFQLPESDTGWYKVGTAGLYLDPGAPGVADRLVATFRELVSNYPQLDGLHLDYIRHPGVLPFVPGSRFGIGLDYGYGPKSRLRFRRETGVRGPYANEASPDPSRLVNANRWDQWRRDKVTELVAKIGTATAEVAPELRLSAAVISYVDRAYLSLAQDWRRWLEDGLLDFAVPMVYSKDERLFRYQVESYAQGATAERIWAGVGVWLFEKQPERARNQIDIVGATAIAGDALFSYDSIVSARDAAREKSATTNLFSALVDDADSDVAPKPVPAQSESAH